MSVKQICFAILFNFFLLAAQSFYSFYHEKEVLQNKFLNAFPDYLDESFNLPTVNPNWVQVLPRTDTSPWKAPIAMYLHFLSSNINQPQSGNAFSKLTVLGKNSGFRNVDLFTFQQTATQNPDSTATTMDISGENSLVYYGQTSTAICGENSATLLDSNLILSLTTRGIASVLVDVQTDGGEKILVGTTTGYLAMIDPITKTVTTDLGRPSTVEISSLQYISYRDEASASFVTLICAAYRNGYISVWSSLTTQNYALRSALTGTAFSQILLYRTGNQILLFAHSFSTAQIEIYNVLNRVLLKTFTKPQTSFTGISSITLAADADRNDILVVSYRPNGAIYKIPIPQVIPKTSSAWPAPILLGDFGLNNGDVNALTFNWEVDPDSEFILSGVPVLISARTNGMIQALYPNNTNWQTLATASDWTLSQQVLTMGFGAHVIDLDDPTHFENLLTIGLSLGEVRALKTVDGIYNNFLMPTPSKAQDLWVIQTSNVNGARFVKPLNQKNCLSEQCWNMLVISLLNFYKSLHSESPNIIESADSAKIKLQEHNIGLLDTDNPVSFWRLRSEFTNNHVMFLLLTGKNKTLLLSVVGVSFPSKPERTDRQSVFYWNPEDEDEDLHSILYDDLFNFPYNSTLVLTWTKTYFVSPTSNMGQGILTLIL
jgi:hypothetical protein